jgi:hypothetical protein
MNNKMNKENKILVGTAIRFSKSGDSTDSYKYAQIEYNPNGQIVQKTIFTENGDVKTKMIYNDWGELQEEIFYKDKNNINFSYKYHRKDSNTIVKEMYLSKGDFHGRWIITSDQKGKPVKEEFYDTQNALKTVDKYSYLSDDKVIKEREGLGSWISQFDENGNIIYYEGGNYSDDKVIIIEYSYSQDLFPLKEKKYENYGEGKILTEVIDYQFIK